MIVSNLRLCILIAVCILLPNAQALSQLQESVGVGGTNREGDVKKVQMWLNQLSDLSGGPQERLTEDGFVGPKTISAIKRFQRMQLGYEDGRIDPGQKTELRLRRLNGEHVLLGTADTADEKKLAEFTSTFANIVVLVDGRKISVRPPYYINSGKRRTDAMTNRNANPLVKRLIAGTAGVSGGLGKATPEQIQSFLQAAVEAGLIPQLTPDGMRAFLAKYGVSTDCSGLASRACNLLRPDSPLDVVNKANTTYLATLSPVDCPADLRAGDLMVKGGSHVRLITDVDEKDGGIEFTTLESTASSIFPNGNGIGERRWHFPNKREFEELEQLKSGEFSSASKSDKQYAYRRK